MDAVDALRGADANPGGAVADQIADLQLQVAQLTQMFRSGVKMETDGGEIFNEAVAVQYQQAKQQQLAVQREVQQLKNAVHDNAESWETASVVYVPFNFGIMPEN